MVGMGRDVGWGVVIRGHVVSLILRSCAVTCSSVGDTQPCVCWDNNTLYMCIHYTVCWITYVLKEEEEPCKKILLCDWCAMLTWIFGYKWVKCVWSELHRHRKNDEPHRYHLTHRLRLQHTILILAFKSAFWGGMSILGKFFWGCFLQFITWQTHVEEVKKYPGLRFLGHLD